MKNFSNCTKLKNRYTGEIVFTENYNDVCVNSSMNFIKVFVKENPERIYLANREAFEILAK